MARFVPDPKCVYCKGSGKVQHKQPPGMSDERWFEFQGFGHCPPCVGWDRAGLVRFNDTDEAALVLFVAVRGPKTLATCPVRTCDDWHDITAFMPPYGQAPVNEVVSHCPNGHELQLRLVAE